jgi:AcrR family transcriptional regulator
MEKMTPKGLKKVLLKETVKVSGRFAAGEDPVKREQILDGAKRVFMRMGFDAASMNDITREAGVSKGTIYVYFANKEDLFVAMVEMEREAFLGSMRTVLAKSENIEKGLYEFGVTFLEHMTDEKVVTAMRTVLGVRERMPDLCSRFFRGPQNLRTVLRRRRHAGDRRSRSRRRPVSRSRQRQLLQIPPFRHDARATVATGD